MVCSNIMYVCSTGYLPPISGCYVWEFHLMYVVCTDSMYGSSIPQLHGVCGCSVRNIHKFYFQIWFLRMLCSVHGTSGVYGCYVWEFHTAASMVCADVWECLAAAACRSPLTLSPACTCSFHPFNISWHSLRRRRAAPRELILLWKLITLLRRQIFVRPGNCFGAPARS